MVTEKPEEGMPLGATGHHIESWAYVTHNKSGQIGHEEVGGRWDP